MNKGDKMLCDLLKDGKRTGVKVPVTVGKIKRNHMTQEPQSVSVKSEKGTCVWVQPQYLHEV